MTDETEQWLAPMLHAMTKHGGRTLGSLIQEVLADGKLDWIALGRLMRDELAWDDYPASPPPPESEN